MGILKRNNVSHKCCFTVFAKKNYSAFVHMRDFFQKHILQKNIVWPLQYHAFRKTSAYNITDPLCA